MSLTRNEQIARLMDRAERAEYLRARGWHRLSTDGPQVWREPDPTQHRRYTLAEAVRIALTREPKETP